jgi:hypothetical protein
MTVEMSDLKWFVQIAFSEPLLPGVECPIMLPAKTPR